MPKYVVTVMYPNESQPRIVGDIHGASIQGKPVVIRIQPHLEDPIKMEYMTKNVKNIKFRNKEHAAAVVRKILKGEYTPRISQTIAVCGTAPPRPRNSMARG